MALTRSLQEVIAAVHFSEPLPLRMLDVADWISVFGGNDPSYNELPTLPRAFIPSPDQQQATPSVSFANEMPSPARVRMRGPQPQDVAVLQSDRVAFGWQRTVEVGEDAAYPGYEVLKLQWRTHIEQFSIWATSRFSQDIQIRLVELSYNNSYPIMLGDRTRRMSDICKMIRPGIRPVNSLQMAWGEFVESGSGVVQATAFTGTAPPGLSIFAVNYFGLLAVPKHQQDASKSAAFAAIDVLHGRVSEMHQAAVEEDA